MGRACSATKTLPTPRSDRRSHAARRAFDERASACRSIRGGAGTDDAAKPTALARGIHLFAPACETPRHMSSRLAGAISMSHFSSPSRADFGVTSI